MSEGRTVDCPHCHATPQTRDVRVITNSPGRGVVEISHTKDCVDYETWTERPGEEPTT